MNADRIDYYANLLRGVPIEDLGRKVREILRDATSEEASAEREACAKVCDELDAQCDKYPAACAAAIRARGEK